VQKAIVSIAVLLLAMTLVPVVASTPTETQGAAHRHRAAHGTAPAAAGGTAGRPRVRPYQDAALW
jgi:hypothetical protein